jgi:competence protein ComEA
MTTLRNLVGAAALALSSLVFAADVVDINTADAQTLAAALDNVGMVKAEAIIAYRQQHGPFTSIDQLADVKGIGAKTVERNRDRLTVGTPNR